MPEVEQFAGVVELAEKVFGTNVKLYIPNQVGIRNPMFANVISLVEYVGNMTEVETIAQNAVHNEELLRRKPIDITPAHPTSSIQSVTPPPAYSAPAVPPAEPSTQATEKVADKPKLGDRVRSIFGSMFD